MIFTFLMWMKQLPLMDWIWLSKVCTFEIPHLYIDILHKYPIEIYSFNSTTLPSSAPPEMLPYLTLLYSADGQISQSRRNRLFCDNFELLLHLKNIYDSNYKHL